MSASSRHYHADLLLLLVTLIAAFGWMFSKEALAGFAPLQFMGIRFTLAATVVAAVGWGTLRALPPASVRRAVLLGLLFAAAMATWILGLEFASNVGEGAFINSLGVVLVPLVARWLFGDKLPWSAWAALPVAVAGLALLSGIGRPWQPSERRQCLAQELGARQRAAMDRGIVVAGGESAVLGRLLAEAADQPVLAGHGAGPPTARVHGLRELQGLHVDEAGRAQPPVHGLDHGL
jgi:drug/metabolite transporter (DMT)-like permease